MPPTLRSADLVALGQRSASAKSVDPTIGSFFGKLVFYAIMVSTLLGVLGKMGISVAGFAAVLAALGFAIGLAFQGTLSNFAAGLMLLMFRPFKVGDVVGAAGITAKVAEIDLFTTKFDTFDNRRIIVPNGDIFRQHHRERDVSPPPPGRPAGGHRLQTRTWTRPARC